MNDTIYKIEAVIKRRERAQLIKSLCLTAAAIAAAVCFAFHFHVL